MPHASSRTAIAFLASLLALFAARDAAAQGTGGTLGTATPLSWSTDFTSYLQRYDAGQKQWIQMNSTEKTYFFNRARCECEADQTNLSGFFRVAIQPAQNTSDKIRALLNQNLIGSGTVRLYAGSNVVNCLNPSAAAGGFSLPSYCVNLINPDQNDAGIDGGMATIAATNVWYSNAIPVAWLFNSVKSPVCISTDSCNAITNCTTANATVNIYFWGQTSSSQTPDMQDATIPVNLVGQSAFVPGDVTVKGGNEALTVNWNWPNGLSPSGNQAFLGVQLFCVRGADTEVFKPGSFGPAFMTQAWTCSNVAPASSTGIAALDPNYLCSGLLPSTSTSYRIEGLQNGITYGVGVAAIDKFQNASVITNLAYAMPVPTVDFYTEYKNNSKGAAQGGYCAIASGKRSPALFGLGTLVALGLIGWRRRRGRGTGPLALVFIAGTLGAGQARAQAVYHDDMSIQDRAKEGWKGTPRDFAIEARFGLYTPDIDSEFSGSGTKPQSFIFGSKKRPMWQIEFDWEILQAVGTLAVGGAVGYYKENAGACYLSSLTATNCERSGDNTSLRLIPLAALVVYRFDVLAEHWKIPLVPYGKAGLNYTLWNVTDGNGNTPNAGGGKGKGGTAGWQAAVGISLQLDWLDPGAARGFDADSGVNHTYAFFEVAHVDGSGLGKKNVLHVGDNTWFTGLMFEF